MTAARRKHWNTLADFESQGRWDCGHAFDAEVFVDTGEEDAEAAFEAGFEDDREHWFEQNEDELEDLAKGLTRDQAYDAWRAGWKACALPDIARAIEVRRDERAADLEMFWISDDPAAFDEGDLHPDDFIEKVDTLTDAIDLAARMPTASVALGDGNAPLVPMFVALAGHSGLEAVYWIQPDYGSASWWTFQMTLLDATNQESPWAERAGATTRPDVDEAARLDRESKRRVRAAMEELDARFARVKAELVRRGYSWKEQNPVRKRARR